MRAKFILNDAFAALIIYLSHNTCLSHDNPIALASIAALSGVEETLLKYDINGTTALWDIPAKKE